MLNNAFSSSLIRIVYQGTKIAYKSLYKSLIEEIESSREAARNRYAPINSTASSKSKDEITLNEAMRILNVDKLDSKQISKLFKHLFEINGKNAGSSFYLQSKIFRAKEKIDLEINRRKIKKRDEYETGI